MHDRQHRFLKLIKHPVKSGAFLLSRLPSAYFSGVRIQQVDQQKCTVSVPYKWFSRNPFGSTYFACLAMAAEMSTGVLAMLHTFQLKPSVSMLVVKLEGEFLARATGITRFTCEDGRELESAVNRAIVSGEPQSFAAKSTGVNEKGERVAVFTITWSFKVRNG